MLRYTSVLSKIRFSVLISIFLELSITIGTVCAQTVPANLNDTLFSTYYQQRVSLFRTLPVQPNQVVFLGNSITDGAEWNELINQHSGILNRGISGDLTAGVLNRLDEVTNRHPSKIFLLIGTNDLARGISADSVIKNILLIATLVHKSTPNTKLYIQSIFPVNPYYKLFASHTGNTQKILMINQILKQKAEKHYYTYIDIHSILKDKNNLMNRAFSNDGLHLKGIGYQRWKHIIYPFLFNTTSEPALLPLPKKIQWEQGCFSLYACEQIIIQNDSLRDIARLLQQMCAAKGRPLAISKNSTVLPSIELKINKALNNDFELSKLPKDKKAEEAYKLTVNADRITLTARTLHGLYHGIQTLNQLMRDGAMVANCRIEDYPSFLWRGYMIDVGRNYQPMALIKQQIDVMAALKMNIFHFHLTEDVAWRLKINKYPQLTEPLTMTRDQGLFYTEADLKELISYCKKRFITLVPEIDMPGHSAAFKRAMGFEMQSDSGVAVLKDILSEICAIYDVPYIHIGADEVHITNKDFLPAMTTLIESKGKKVIGWEPGGNFSASTLRQLWKDDAWPQDKSSEFQQIDSRNLYINHMDAEESVVSIYNHLLDDVNEGNHMRLGGTLCLWNDRKLAVPIHNLTQNPTYPSLMAFAEKSWCGGGMSGNQVGLNYSSKEQLQQFTSFENRLLAIQSEQFSYLPFNYVRQANISWRLIGPYPNGGDLTKSFPPETKDVNLDKIEKGQTVHGATIILRHFWNPVVKGAIVDPKENTTYYAYGRYLSVVDTTATLWLGFYDYSRSTASAPPKPSTWNNLNSQIWLNDTLIQPPNWQRAGQLGDLEIPYFDENYYFRRPQQVHLKKGWNTLLLKLPVGSFNSGIWYSPVKWMFTAVFVRPQAGIEKGIGATVESGNMQQDPLYYRQ